MGYSLPFICNEVIFQLSVIKPEDMELISHNRGARANRRVSANLDRTGARLTEWADQRLTNRSPRSTFTT